MVLIRHRRQPDVIQFGHKEIGYDGVMENSYKCGMRLRSEIKKTVVTSSTASTSFERESDDRNRHLAKIKINCKGQPFPRHDVVMFPREAYSTMSSYSRSQKYNCEGGLRVQRVINITVETSSSATTGSENESGRKRQLVEIEIRGYLQFPRHDVKVAFPRVVYSTTKTIGGGENRRFIEHFTKTFGLRDQQPIVVDIRSRFDIDVPLKWMKYPSANRNQQVLPLPPTEDGDEEESDKEYDEFEEEIAVMDVQRNPIWSKVLEIPEPDPEPKVGVPIEDLVEIPTLQANQESAPNKLLIYEKIEPVERPPVVHAELPDLQNL